MQKNLSLFSFARLRLTAWYALGLTVLSLFFSLGIYRVQTAELSRFESAQRARLELQLEQGGFFARGRLAPLLLDQELITDAKHRILFRLGVVNGIVIILATGVGYFLAGRTLTPIEQMVHKQRRFVSDASHELRTPLTALRTGMEVFLRGPRRTLKQAREELSGNLAEVKRLQRLTDSLLTLSRPSTPRPTRELELSTLIRGVVRKLRPVAQAKKISLTTRLGKGAVLGVQDELEELFTILLDNAVKYTPQGGKVAVTLAKRGKHLIAQIQDTGIGIASGDLPYIFDRFFRADNARAKDGESGGYGLGLAIARQIADHHHAKIEVISKQDKGTTFQLKFRSV